MPVGREEWAGETWDGQEEGTAGPGLQEKLCWWPRGQPRLPEQGKGAFLSPLLHPLAHSSATKLHLQPGGEDFGIVTRGGLVTPEAGDT